MKLIENNKVRFGIFDNPVEVNHQDFQLKSPFGKRVRGIKNRLNRFHFVGLAGKKYMAGLAVVDLKLITSGFCYVYDRASKKTLEASKVSLPSAKKRYIGNDPEKPESFFSAGKLKILIKNGAVSVKSPSFDLDFTSENGKNPLRICTRTGYSGWTFTRKESPLKIKEGTLNIKGEKTDLSSPEFYALSDWTCGYMRRETFWQWASSAAILPCGRSLGLNLSCGVNETSYTENAFWIDGVRTKVDLVDFHFDSIKGMWKIESFDKRVNLHFTPDNIRNENLNMPLFASKFSQLTGTFNGILKDINGEEIKVENCPGWTEDHFAKW